MGLYIKHEDPPKEPPREWGKGGGWGPGAHPAWQIIPNTGSMLELFVRGATLGLSQVEDLSN